MTKPGDTFFLLDSRDAESKNSSRHLYIVVSDPIQSPDQIFIVPLTTREHYRGEQCCILRVGDHSFVTRDTVVVYRIPPAELVTQLQLDQWEAANILKRKSPVTTDILERVRKGYTQSHYRTDRVEQLLWKQGLID
jgi:hypothetical protein